MTPLSQNGITDFQNQIYVLSNFFTVIVSESLDRLYIVMYKYQVISTTTLQP